MNYVLKRLSVRDGKDIYDMLQAIPRDENGFINNANGLSYAGFQDWLVHVDADSHQTGLIDGWKVPQITFWLYADGRPVAVGKLRLFLTDALREHGGHIGYAVAPGERGKGFGKVLLRELLKEANRRGVDRALITVQKGNEASVKVALANGGVMERTTTDRHYIWCDTGKTGNAS